MSLQESIAHYRILSKLGEGAMGAVYRARDTKLNRDVAIKVLPDSFVFDADRVARFRREAQVLASLNHPNIGAIYGFEDRAIVMELVEGSNLRGPLPLETALNYARQIAAGLEVAHEKGIVHRDLKPANIRVTPEGQVKLLDFGLAKAATDKSDPPSYASPTMSPTITLSIDLTQAGALLGTPAYMSPEQAQGKLVDKRADIWSFGVVLYELLTGRHPFAVREPGVDILTAVITREPDFTAVPPDARVVRLLRRCLQKDPMLRLRDIGEARILLNEPKPAAGEGAPRRSWLTWAAGAVALASLGAAGVAWMRPPETRSGYGTMRFRVSSPRGATLPLSASTTQWAPSPDGRNLAMVASVEGKAGLWLRALDSQEARLFDHTDDASTPFWSPDGKSIGFFGGGQIRRVAVGGGDVLPVCDLPHGAVANGATWSRDGFIIFNAGPGPLLRVPATGGVAAALTSLSKGEEAHEWPQMLPGGREVLYFAKAPQGAPENAIYIQNLASGKRDRVIQSFTRALWSPPGYLLFTRGESLLAQPLDSRSHQLRGDAVTIADDVLVNESNGRSTVAASENGMLIYRSSGGRDRQIVWYDRSGKSVAIAAEPGPYRSLALSPDGKTLAVLSGSSTSNVDLWTIDLASGAMTEMTRNDRLEPSNPPVWSPDSQSVGVSPRGGGIEVIGVASAKANVLSKKALYVQDWSPDGRSILCTDVMNRRVLLVPIDQPQEPKDILATPYAEWGFHYSPGGGAVVFISNESGDTAVYVASFPSFAEKRRVSLGPGSFPVWGANGRVFYHSGVELMEAEVRTGPHIEIGERRRLFQSVANRFAASGDGERFLMMVPPQKEPNDLMVILNWSAALRRP